MSISGETGPYLPSVQIHIDRIAQKLQDGKAAIMVGAGFSRNVAPNQLFPDWTGLGNAILKDLKKTYDTGDDRFISVLRLAGEFEAVYGRNALDELLQKTIPDVRYEPSALHIKLLELPWVDIFTTNYDTFLERARVSVGSRNYDLVLTQKDLVQTRSPRIIKLHGSFPSQRPFIVTEEDYRKYPQEFSLFVNTVQQSFVENLFCLIGFSGDDPNFFNWIGWIRDNLGKDFPSKIYLLCIGDIAEPQRAILEQRNIVPVCLTKIKNHDGSPISPNDAFFHFFNHLEFSIKETSFLWGTSSTMILPKRDLSYETNCCSIVETWRKERLNYPGWTIVPYRHRNTLWTYTLTWLQYYLCNDNYDKLPKEIQFDYTYELCWRLGKCLYPLLDERLVDRCEKFIQNSEQWINTNFDQWVELALWLLREYRTDGKLKKWECTKAIVEKHLTRLSGKQKASLSYEKCLYAIFVFDIPLLKKELYTWQEANDLPFFEAKKAALYAEIGDWSTARKILEISLARVRKLQNESPENERIHYFSQEGYVLSIFQGFETAESAIQRKGEFHVIREKYEHRYNFLRQYQCNPTDELLLFSIGLKSEPPPAFTPETIIRHFDIGKKTYNYSWGEYVDNDSLLADSFLIFTEETGIPSKLPGFNFDLNSVLGSIKRKSKFSFHWALATFVRTGNLDNVDVLLNRKVLVSLTIEQIDFYVKSLIEAMKKTRGDVENHPPNSWSFQLGVHFAQVVPEILSRLCTKCSYGAMLKLLNFLRYLYTLEKKSYYKGVANLANRLFSNWPEDKKGDLLSVLQMIPQSKTENQLIDVEFPDLWSLFRYDYQETLPLNDEFINDAFKKLDSDDIESRSSGIAILNGLYTFSLLNEQQKETFKTLLWAKRDLQGFPLQSQQQALYKFAFLDLPHPEDVDVVQLFKQSTFGRRDFYSESTERVQSGEVSISMTGGFSRLLNEWNGGYGVFSKNRIPLSEEEAVEFLVLLCDYWNTNRNALNQEASHPLFSVADEYKKRFDSILGVLARVVIPNLSDNASDETKRKLHTLISEMDNAGLSCGAAQVATIGIFPEQFEIMWKKCNEKILLHDPPEGDSTLFGIVMLLWMKANGKTSLRKDDQTLITPIVDSIKRRTISTLASALDYFRFILENMPNCVNDENINDICSGLDILSSESDLTNGNSNIPEDDRLLYRQHGMYLVGSLYRYFQNKGQDVPLVLQAWKQISESQNEFWEIRNAWRGN